MSGPVCNCDFSGEIDGIPVPMPGGQPCPVHEGTLQDAMSGDTVDASWIFSASIIPVVLVAELRRQAEVMRSESNAVSQLDARGLLLAAKLLDERAAKLDPQGGAR